MSEEVMRETLADYSHSAWAGWMKYQFSKAELQPDGTWIIPAWAVERWQRQMNTPYAELPEEEKASDRKGADEILAIVGKEAAYERGKAEERARIEARLQAKREGDNSLAENAYELGAPSVNVASFRIAKQVWDMAIEIVNQE